LWKTAGESVLDYADVYEKRCIATLRSVRFGYAFLALQLAIAVPWLTWDFTRREISPARYAFSMGVLAALTVAFMGWFRRSRRRAVRELIEVTEFRRGFHENGEII
jgi:hypothetical protein